MNIENLIRQKSAYIETLSPNSDAWILANETLNRLIAERHRVLGIKN
jgi:hypothetical protein